MSVSASNLDSPLVMNRLARGAMIPRFWGMEWDTERIALRIAVHRHFIEHDSHAAISPTAPVVSAFQRDLGLGIFSGDLSQDRFGFDSAFVSLGWDSSTEFAGFLVPYPQVDNVVGACDRCDEYDGTEHCLACQGTGELREIDWNAVHTISASLHLFFCMVHFPDSLTPCLDPQLMEIEVSAGINRAALSGEFSLPLRSWLSSRLCQSRINEMERAMQRAHVRLFGSLGMSDAAADFSFRAGIDSSDGWLNCSCPGLSGGASIHPNHSSFRQPVYEFLSHGMDSPMQMLTILAGLAALHEKVDPVWRVTMPVPRRSAS